MKDIVIISPSRGGHNWVTEMVKTWCLEDRVFRFENVQPEHFDHSARTRREAGKMVNMSGEVAKVLLVRDYLNWTASWTKYCINRGNAWASKSVIKRFEDWYAITREAFNDTNYIGNKYTLIYDQFVQNQEYRKAICALLEGEYSEFKIDYVPKGGEGSSFDRLRLQSNGSQMETRERWRWWLTDEGEDHFRYLKVKKYIIEYYAEQFDLNAEQSKLVNKVLNDAN